MAHWNEATDGVGGNTLSYLMEVLRNEIMSMIRSSALWDIGDTPPVCIPLICINNRYELIQTYQRESVQQITHVIFCKLICGGFILSESESV